MGSARLGWGQGDLRLGEDARDDGGALLVTRYQSTAAERAPGASASGAYATYLQFGSVFCIALSLGMWVALLLTAEPPSKKTLEPDPSRGMGDRLRAARERVQAAEAARIQTESRREVTDDQVRTVGTSKSPEPAAPLYIHYIDEGDCYDYARALARAFNNSIGWKVQPFLPVKPALTAATGLAVLVADKNNLTAQEEFLTRALERAKIAFDMWQRPSAAPAGSGLLFVTVPQARAERRA